MALKAQVQVPGIEDEDPTVEEIELPPVETWPKEVTTAAPAAGSEPVAAQVPSRPAAEAAKLEFVGGEMVKVIDLEFPFKLDGVVISAVTIRRLTVAEVSEVVDRRSDEDALGYQLFSAMTGLPVPVLRGLIDDDGTAVTEACFHFLPRRFRPAES